MQAYSLPQATRPALNLEFCRLLGKVKNTSPIYEAARTLAAEYIATTHAGAGVSPTPSDNYSVTVAENAALRQTVYELQVYDTSLPDESRHNYAYLISVRFIAPEADSKDPVVNAMVFDKRVSDGRNRH